jgi:hypothetical protein
MAHLEAEASTLRGGGSAIRGDATTSRGKRGDTTNRRRVERQQGVNGGGSLAAAAWQRQLGSFAGKVGCRRVKTRVKTTDMCLSGVADMLADMLATQLKKLSIGVPGRHVTACHLLTCRQFVGNMTNI